MVRPHPLHTFAFCPRCGSSGFATNDSRSKRCPRCGFTYYLNASAATAAVVLNDKCEVLVLRRAFEPAKGTLDIPGGFVDPGESVDEGMRREILEETGCRVDSLEWLFSLPNNYRYSGFDVPTADSFFLCRVLPGQCPQARDDAASLMWIAPQSLNPEEFGMRSVSLAVGRIKPRLVAMAALARTGLPEK